MQARSQFRVDVSLNKKRHSANLSGVFVGHRRRTVVRRIRGDIKDETRSLDRRLDVVPPHVAQLKLLRVLVVENDGGT